MHNPFKREIVRKYRVYSGLVFHPGCDTAQLVSCCLHWLLEPIDHMFDRLKFPRSCTVLRSQSRCRLAGTDAFSKSPVLALQRLSGYFTARCISCEVFGWTLSYWGFIISSHVTRCRVRHTALELPNSAALSFPRAHTNDLASQATDPWMYRENVSISTRVLVPGASIICHTSCH